MQRAFKAKVTYLLEEKLEAQDASDEMGDMNESEHSDELFDFYTKQAIIRAETVLQGFLKVLLIKSLKCKLVHALSNFRNDVLQNLLIFYKYNTALPSGAVVKQVFFAGKDKTLFYAG